MFESAKLKLERAEQHVRDLDSAHTAFVDQRPHRPVIKGERKDGVWRGWIEVIVDRQLPPEFALILGDAIHNYRCVLDHLVWELVGVDGGTQDRHTKFPFGRTRVDFEAMTRGVITPAQSTKNFLASLAVYPMGQGEALYAVHALDNADKHRVITPVLHFSYLGGILLFDMQTGERFHADPVYVGPVGDGSTIAFEIPEGCGIEADHRFYPTPDIFFPKIDVFPNEPVIPALAWISSAVEATVTDFERFATGRMLNSTP